MREIWKYTLRPGKQSFGIPQGASVLHTHEQRGEVCLWALVDPTERQAERVFEVVATGQPFDLLGKYLYIGTVHLEGGLLVFHVFEIE